MTQRSLPRELLAKGLRRGRARLSLQQHSFDTESAALELFGADSRWGASWRRFFRLGEDYERFMTGLRVAALFHDLGKANADFQTAVTKTGDQVAQTIRHEHISALILHLPTIRQWLVASDVVDFEAVTAAVLSHHLKASEDGRWKWAQPRTARSTVDLFLEHPEVRDVMHRVGELVGSAPPLAPLPSCWSGDVLWQRAFADGTQTGRRFRRELHVNAPRRRLVLATKAGLIAADSVASALVREGIGLRDWIRDMTGNRVLAADVRRDVIDPRIACIEQRVAGAFRWHRFQELAAERGSRALLLASCGAGKSLAAWRWAEQVAGEHNIGRIVFLYPTRGTATEGFRDYVAAAPEVDAALLHGSAEYELRGMAANPDDALEGQDFSTDERLYALGYWSKRYFSATVDQFLGFLAHSYKGLCLLPVLADSAVIIDEVHSFDRRMFDALVGFLREFDVPVLCMTATLSRTRRAAIEQVGFESFPTADDRTELDDLERLECHPRYEINSPSCLRTALAAAQDALGRGDKVLWVVNRVSICQRIGRELGEECIVYHSRFRLTDRQAAHRRTIAAFKEARPVVAVTTQVCEMSLDLDADLLVTELAPPASLVQRFGRANRHLARGTGFRAAIHVYEPATPHPYEREELDAARSMVAALGSGPTSQRALAEALETHACLEPVPQGTASFLDSGYYATRDEFRDIDDLAVRCVLDRDLNDVLATDRARQPIDGFVLPVPRSELTEEVAGLPSYLRVASASRYDLRLGYLAE